MRQAGLGRKLLADGIELPASKRGEEIALHDDALAVAPGEALIGEMFGPRLHGVAHLAAKAGL
ncbi:hypothetical protein D3C87_2076370 [compost metagenome]